MTWLRIKQALTERQGVVGALVGAHKDLSDSWPAPKRGLGNSHYQDAVHGLAKTMLDTMRSPAKPSRTRLVGCSVGADRI